LTQRCYFVDTSYLLEHYRVPGRHDLQASVIVRGKFKNAWDVGDTLFLPAVCVLELGNLIAELKKLDERRRHAALLRDDVVRSLSNDRIRPFTVLEAPSLQDLPALLASWVGGHVDAPRGLVDAALAERAREHKRRHTSSLPVLVHIWTRDRQLKGIEPDPEPDPFVGWQLRGGSPRRAARVGTRSAWCRNAPSGLPR
jgi:hypothetical protein